MVINDQTTAVTGITEAQNLCAEMQDNRKVSIRASANVVDIPGAVVNRFLDRTRTLEVQFQRTLGEPEPSRSPTIERKIPIDREKVVLDSTVNLDATRDQYLIALGVAKTYEALFHQTREQIQNEWSDWENDRTVIASDGTETEWQ